MPDYGPDLDENGVPYCCFACPFSEDWRGWCLRLNESHELLRKRARKCPPPECPARAQMTQN